MMRMLKLALFSFFIAMSSYAYAEYYLVYSSPDYYNSCFHCAVHTHHKHRVHHKKTSVTHHKHTVHHHYPNRGGLYVYYPVVSDCSPCSEVWTLGFCNCCPNPNRVHTQWGDYVVFSSRPASRQGIMEEKEVNYSPDLSTADDYRADLEVN